MTLVNQPTNKTARKVKASTVFGGIGATAGIPLGDILASYIAYKEPFFKDQETALAMVVSTVVVMLSTWAGGYYTRERLDNMVIKK